MFRSILRLCFVGLKERAGQRQRERERRKKETEGKKSMIFASNSMHIPVTLTMDVSLCDSSALDRRANLISWLKFSRSSILLDAVTLIDNSWVHRHVRCTFYTWSVMLRVVWCKSDCQSSDWSEKCEREKTLFLFILISFVTLTRMLDLREKTSSSDENRPRARERRMRGNQTDNLSREHVRSFLARMHIHTGCLPQHLRIRSNERFDHVGYVFALIILLKAKKTHSAGRKNREIIAAKWPSPHWTFNWIFFFLLFVLFRPF